MRFVTIIGLLLISTFSYSQKMWAGYEHLMTPVRNYVIYQTTDVINIDGKPNENS